MGNIGERGEDRKFRFTFHLSGIPGKAAGNLCFNVFWVMADVIATPHTVPSDRIKYTVDAETA